MLNNVARVPSVNTVVSYITNTLNGIERVVKQQDAGKEVLDQCEKTLSEVLSHLNRIKSVIDESSYDEILFSIVNLKADVLERQANEREAHLPSKIARKPNISKKGNSYCDINGDALKQLLSLGFTVKKIAKDGLLGGVIHPNTIYRFMKRNNIVNPKQAQSIITDAELSDMITEINQRFPNSGANEIVAHLKCKDPPVFASYRKVSQLLRDVDPVGSSRRWVQVVQRRSYHVETPNSLWHIDTNHKLIRWNFVVDGCIDGYSRLIPYLNVHTNNFAISAFNDFVDGVKQFGIPSRIRADCGGEFTHIKKIMNEINGHGRGSFIAGRSVHNQRIERLWRDVYSKVLDKYHRTFHYMETKNILDIDDENHMAVLHHVFLPRICKDIKDWQKAHNCHSQRTAKRTTPMKLWYEGIVKNSGRDLTSISNVLNLDTSVLQQQIDDFISNNALDEPTTINIILPRFSLPLTAAEETSLQANVDVLKDSDVFGIEVYAEVLKFVSNCMGP